MRLVENVLSAVLIIGGGKLRSEEALKAGLRVGSSEAEE